MDVYRLRPLLFRFLLSSVKNVEYEVRVLHHPLRSLYSLSLDFVFAFPEPRSVEEPHGNTVHLARGLEVVPCRTGSGRDDCPVLLEKRIEEARLSRIGVSREYDLRALGIYTVGTERGAHSLESCNQTDDTLFREDPVLDYLILSVVKLHFEGGEYIHDFVPYFLRFPSHGSRKTPECILPSLLASGLHEFLYSLGLGEVHPAVHECAVGEFTPESLTESGSLQYG